MTGDTTPRLLSALQAWGRNATSFQLLERGFLVWLATTDADPTPVAPSNAASSSAAPTPFIGYVDTGRAWVAGGEPVAPAEEVPLVALRFVAAGAAAGRRAAFFATEGALVSVPELDRLLLGEQPIWDPAAWSTMLSTSRSLRAQLRRAQAKGVSIRRLSSADVAAGTELRVAMERVMTRWQATRAMATMGFLVQLSPFAHAEERLLFVAEQQGVPVALLSMAPVYARDGWLFEDLLRDPSAPNGTTELLVDAGMRAIAARGCRWATLGLAPLKGEVGPWLRAVRRLASPLFNFDGLAAFKTKLHPDHWEPVWLVHPPSVPVWRALLDALVAFADGSLLRFGWRTLMRGPRPVLVLMTALLVPWTLVLALLDGARWFPSAAAQIAWVAFDVVLIAGLLLLLRRWRGWLGVTLAVAVTGDALTTLAQAVLWYVPRINAWWEGVLIGVACSGPLLAAMVLWGTVRRQRVLEGTL